MESLFRSSVLKMFIEICFKLIFSAILTYNEACFIRNVSKFLSFLESVVGDLHQEIPFNSDFQPRRFVTKSNLQKTIDVPRCGNHKTFADFFGMKSVTQFFH
jgi:hypothetical protein